MRIKEFYKENSFLVFKLLVLHIVMAIFGLMTYLPFNTDTPLGKTLTLVSGILVFFFYYYLVNVELWHIGATDKISSDAGRKKAIPLKGLYLGLTAAIPDFILCWLYVFFWYYQTYEWAMTPASVITIITALWEGMFLSLQHGLFSGSGYFFIAVPFIPPIFAMVAYYLGTKEFTLFPKKKPQK